MNDLLTTTELAKATGMPLCQVLYLLLARRIDPVRRIAHVRLYPPETVERLKAIRRQMPKRRRAVAS